MARTRSITSINNEIKKVEEELIKVHNKQEELEQGCLIYKMQNKKLKPNRSWMHLRKVAKACTN